MCDELDDGEELQADGHAEYCLWREVKRWVGQPLNHPRVDSIDDHVNAIIDEREERDHVRARMGG